MNTAARPSRSSSGTTACYKWNRTWQDALGAASFPVLDLSGRPAGCRAFQQTDGRAVGLKIFCRRSPGWPRCTRSTGRITRTRRWTSSCRTVALARRPCWWTWAAAPGSPHGCLPGGRAGPRHRAERRHGEPGGRGPRSPGVPAPVYRDGRAEATGLGDDGRCRAGGPGLPLV